jgi:hypothetical protein
MNAEDREGIRRVEQLLRQHADHEEAWRKQLKDELDELRDEMRVNHRSQQEWNQRFDQRQRETERKLAARDGIGRAAVWVVGLLGTIGTIIAALFSPWKF